MHSLSRKTTFHKKGVDNKKEAKKDPLQRSGDVSCPPQRRSEKKNWAAR